MASDDLIIVTTTAFKKHLKRAKKRNKDLNKLGILVSKIQARQTLEPQYKDHQLVGGIFNLKKECHIEPDWLLVYDIQDTRLILIDTGSHSDLFKMSRIDCLSY